MITQKELKSILFYDPGTGLFTWIAPASRRMKVGDIAGCKQGKGYIDITIKWKKYQAHRLAFLYMLGRYPANETDHINGEKDDNRWNNLREATRSQNSTNRLACGATGVKGVYFNKEKQKYQCQIVINGTNKYLGRFEDTEEAGTVYKTAALAHQKEFYPHRVGVG